MAGEVQPPAVLTWKQPTEPRLCLAVLPIEIHFRIINLALATGQERDVSALAKTSKTMYFIVNHELHRLVVKHKTFFLVHWAAMEESRLNTLKFALAHGANPNQMRTSSDPLGTNINSFRPLGCDLQTRTHVDLDACVGIKRREIIQRGLSNFSVAPTSLWWHQVWFSCTSLSTPSSAQMNLLMDHYRHVMARHTPQHSRPFFDNNETRLVALPAPLDDDFAFPETMPPVYMDRRDTKVSFVRLFQFWDTPLHIAAAHDHVSVTKALLANGGDVDCTATQACRCLRNAQLTSLTRPTRGNLVVSYTPLHVTICMGSYRVPKVLVTSGANRMAMVFRSNGAREWLVETALHRALSSSCRGDFSFNYNFIEFLLDQGYAARLEYRNFEGMTPLQIACLADYEPAKMDILRLLLRYGADPNSQ